MSEGRAFLLINDAATKFRKKIRRPVRVARATGSPALNVSHDHLYTLFLLRTSNPINSPDTQKIIFTYILEIN